MAAAQRALADRDRDVVRSSAPFTRNSHSPSSSRLPTTTGWFAVPYSSSRTCTSISEALLLDHDDEVEPAANFFSSACDSGQGHATL